MRNTRLQCEDDFKEAEVPKTDASNEPMRDSEGGSSCNDPSTILKTSNHQSEGCIDSV